MNKQRRYNSRRASLTKHIVPSLNLTKWHRLVIFERLSQLCLPALEHYQHNFCLFNERMESRLADIAQLPTRPEREHQLTFQHIKNKFKKLTALPYGSALCTSWPLIDDPEKYSEWLGLIVLCCCQLHIQGKNESAIDSALREIRLIATDDKHSPIFQLLPRATKTDSLKRLGDQLESIRKNYSDTSFEYSGIGYLSVVIRRAADLSTGITRHRKITIKFDEPESIKTTSLDPVDESGLEVEQLEVELETTTSSTEDESGKIQSSKTLRIHDPHQRKSALVIQALQGQRLAEQLSTRQQSLPCSFEQATEWDLRHLITYCVNELKQQSYMAGWVLLALVTGRSPAWLHAQEQLAPVMGIAKEHPCLLLSHRVPAGNQHPDLDKTLPGVSENLFLLLPIQLKDWVSSYNRHQSPPTIIEIRAWLKPINKQHMTRLTLGRIARYLEHWLLNQGADRTTIALIRGESHRVRPALAYSCIPQDRIVEDYCSYLDAIFAFANLGPKLPARRSTPVNLGSRLNLPPRVLHNFFTMLAQPLQIKSDIWEFHNQYVTYVWALLTFSTGHRDVNAPMGQLTDYNPHQRTWWISDKERRHGRGARTIIIPETAALQVKLYIKHLRALAGSCRFIAPGIADRCQQALSGSGNLLFAITDKNQNKIPQELTPSLLDKLLQNRLPWAKNWARHHLRSELADRNISSELIDGWMGHEEIGEEALGHHSFLSMSQFHRISDTIESILNTHQIEAISGWKTR